MTDQFAELISSFLEVELLIRRHDTDEEAGTNMLAVAVPPEFDEEGAARALEHVGNSLAALLGEEAPPVTFYAWYDEMAGQLRCSLASVATNNLPFGRTVTPTSSPADVIQRITDDPYRGSIPLDEFVEGNPASPETPGAILAESMPVYVYPVRA